MSFLLILHGVGMGAGSEGSSVSGIVIIVLELEGFDMQSRQVKAGAVEQSVEIRVLDSAGAPDSSLAYDTAGLEIWYRRQGGAVVAITLADLASLATAHTAGGFKLIDDGYYRLDLPDAAVATGATRVLVGGSLSTKVILGASLELVGYDAEELAKELNTE